MPDENKEMRFATEHEFNQVSSLTDGQLAKQGYKKPKDPDDDWETDSSEEEVDDDDEAEEAKDEKAEEEKKEEEDGQIDTNVEGKTELLDKNKKKAEQMKQRIEAMKK